MIFAIIFSGIFVLCMLVLLATPVSRVFPWGIKIMPAFAGGLIWLYTYLKLTYQRTGFLEISLLIIFYFITITMILPAALGAFIISLGDQGKVLPPRLFAAPPPAPAPAKLAIVYHPGLSGFMGQTLQKLAGELNLAHYNVVLYTAHRKLRFKPGEYAAVGIASPVYAGRIRPPLASFLAQVDLSGKKCFIVLTGSAGETAPADLGRVRKLLQEKNCVLIGEKKFSTDTERSKLNEEISQFRQGLADQLKPEHSV